MRALVCEGGWWSLLSMPGFGVSPQTVCSLYLSLFSIAFLTFGQGLRSWQQTKAHYDFLYVYKLSLSFGDLRR